MTHYHAVVWLDHHEAKVFHFNYEDVERLRIMPTKPNVHIHHHHGAITDGRAKEDQRYYHNIASAFADAGEVLICGPGQAKVELMKHLEKHDPLWKQKVVGVEPVDHPTDAQLVDHARKYFKSKDRLRPQRG